MKLNQKVRYGLACLFELAKTPTEYVEAERIATVRQLPPAYAQKVLHALGTSGLVYSQKGSGYRLARPLQDITALDVINALSADEGTSLDGAGLVIERCIDRALAGVSLQTLAAAA